MFEKEADEMAVNNAKKKYGLEGSICMNIQECAYVNGFQQGAEFGYNKAKEEIREELLELKADSFDAGMFLRVDETLRKLGIKED